MEIFGWIGDQAFSLVVGIAAPWAYHQIQFRLLKRHAPSAKSVGAFHVVLTQEDYDRLPKKRDDVLYYPV